MLVQPFVNYNMAGGWYFTVSSPIITVGLEGDNASVGRAARRRPRAESFAWGDSL
jgi:hypothetical protein